MNIDDVSSSIKQRIRYRNKSIWMCYLCHPEGLEVTFDIGKEWFQKDLHLLRYHQKEILLEANKKYLKQKDEDLR